MAAYQMQGWIFPWWFVCHTCHYKIETADSALTRQLAALTWSQLCGWVPWGSAESPNVHGRGLEESPVLWPRWVLWSQRSLPRPTRSSHSYFTHAFLPCGSGAFSMNPGAGRGISIYIPPSASAGFFRCDRIHNTRSKLTWMHTAFLRSVRLYCPGIQLTREPCLTFQ